MAFAVFQQRGRQAESHCLPWLRDSGDDLLSKLETAKAAVAASRPYRTRAEWYYSPDESEGQLAFLFPGQGSQWTDMLLALALAFSVPEAFEADRS